MFLTARPHTLDSLTAADEAAMFALYDRYYGEADRAVFVRDLRGKSHAVLLRDGRGRILGFSTLKLFDHHGARVLYSGDTIIDRAYWGRNDFAQTWLRLAGHLKAEAPEMPLYWLLIVKGQRTYRYLGLFARRYWPHHAEATPPEAQTLIDDIAGMHFGALYDAPSGRVFFPRPRSYLREALEPMPPKELARPEVRFFMQRNPGYAQGDELVCLCDLAPGNLTRLSRAWFEEGMTLGIGIEGEGPRRAIL